MNNIRHSSSHRPVALLALCATAFVAFAGCGKVGSQGFLGDESGDGSTKKASSSSGKYIYVLNGACYAGGATVTPGYGTVAKYSLATGALVGVLADYNSFSPGDLPVGIGQFDTTANGTLLVGVENAAGRRVDLVNKVGGGINTFLTNANINGALRSLTFLGDGGILLSKSSAFEKFSSARIRITQGVNPYVSAPAGACSTSTTLMSASIELPGGKLVLAHAAATPNNKLMMVSAGGYAVAGDCLTTVAAPITTSLPSALLQHSSGKLIAAWGSSTLSSNLITGYDVTPASSTINGAVSAYTNTAVINGPSALAEDVSTGTVYVANGVYSNIEKFSFDSSSKTLTRVGNTPFIPSSVYTKCISGMVVGD
jgi:hypothetical protein